MSFDSLQILAASTKDFLSDGLNLAHELSPYFTIVQIS